MRWVSEWGRAWVVVACLGLVVVGWQLWPERVAVMESGLWEWLMPRLAVVVVVGVVVALAEVLVHRVLARRGEERVRVQRRISARLEEITQPGGHTVVKSWRGTHPRRVLVQLPEAGTGAPGEDGPAGSVPARVARHLGESTGARWGVHVRRFSRGRQLVAVPARGEPEPDDVRAEVRDRVHQVMKQTVPKAQKVIVKSWDEGNSPSAIMVTYEPTPKISAPSIEAAILRVVGNSFPGRWRADWDREHDLVTFRVRPGLPDLARRPRDLSRPAGHVELRYGVDEDGKSFSWSWAKGHSPHALVVGETGGGKTVCLRAMVLDAISQGVTVYGADPKRIELIGMRGLPGVEAIATSPEAIVELIEEVHELMERRYVLIESRQVKEGAFDPVLFVLDEFFILSMRVNAMWKAAGEKGEHPVLAKVWDLLALARSAQIHLAIGIQRPDVTFIPGASRDNVKHRVSLKGLSQSGAEMLWEDAAVGRDLPEKPGRATAGRPGNVKEIQVYLLPDPDPHTRGDRTPEELAELEEIFAGAATSEGDIPSAVDGELVEEEGQGQAAAAPAADAGEEVAAGESAEATVPVQERPAAAEVAEASQGRAVEQEEMIRQEADAVRGGHPAAGTGEPVGVSELDLVAAESLVVGDEVEIDGDLVRLSDVDCDPIEEDYVVLEWAQGTLSVPASERVPRVA